MPTHGHPARTSGARGHSARWCRACRTFRRASCGTPVPAAPATRVGSNQTAHSNSTHPSTPREAPLVAEEHWRVRRGGVETALRTSAVWSAVQELLATQEAILGRTLRVIDLGGGTGGLAVPIAGLG